MVENGPKMLAPKEPKMGFGVKFFSQNVNNYMYKYIAVTIMHHFLVPLSRFVKKPISRLKIFREMEVSEKWKFNEFCLECLAIPPPSLASPV